MRTLDLAALSGKKQAAAVNADFT